MVPEEVESRGGGEVERMNRDDPLLQGKLTPASDFAPVWIAEATAHMADSLNEIRDEQIQSAGLARRRHRHMLIATWVASVAAVGAFGVSLAALLL
jgi:hypothetical protein